METGISTNGLPRTARNPEYHTCLIVIIAKIKPRGFMYSDHRHGNS